MSASNVERVRAYIDAYNRRDFDAAVEDFDRQIAWVLPERQSSDSCEGPDEIRRFWEGLDSTFEDLQLEPQEYVDAGELVATRLRYYGHGKASGLRIETEMYHQVATFRGDRIVRLEYFGSWPEALAAVGGSG
jgi:ketosteroid isomerase-like protein